MKSLSLLLALLCLSAFATNHNKDTDRDGIQQLKWN
jgi:hypothetical protein